MSGSSRRQMFESLRLYRGERRERGEERQRGERMQKGSEESEVNCIIQNEERNGEE